MAITIDISSIAKSADGKRYSAYRAGDAPVGGGASGALYDGLFDYTNLATPQNLTLHPTGNAQTASQIRISFAIPFPKGALSSVSSLVITDASNNEISTHVELIAPWRDFSDNSSTGVRSARVWMNYTFNDATPISLKFKTGTRTLELGTQSNYKNDWTDISTQPANEYNNEYTTGTFYEPLVYATCDAAWLCSCNLKPRMQPLSGTFSDGGNSYVGTDISTPEWGYDEASLGYAHSVVNDVPAHVTLTDDTGNVKINYEVDYEPWLYDRAMFLYVCYIRTGDVKWLRHAVRASQFYSAHMPATGYFDLRANDIKYSYTFSPMLAAMLVGDTDQSTTMSRAVLPGRAGDFTYNYVGGQLWTERNMGYIIEQELCYWEYSGDTTAYNNAKTYLQSGIDQVASPYDSSADDGWIKHTIGDHEGGAGSGSIDDNVFSPWMGGIMLNAYFRAYFLSGSNTYLQFITGHAGIYETCFYSATFDGNTETAPYYLVGEQLFTDGGIFTDIEHVPDVLNAINLVLWGQQALGETLSTTLLTNHDLLKSTAGVDQAYWYRNTQATIDAGYTVWRVKPPRRTTWQHGIASTTKYLETTREAV